MPTYITLLRFTQKGIEGIREGPARLDAAKEVYRAAGAKLKDFYLVTGRYDAVVVAEAPDDETAASVLLSADILGNIRTQTLRAFTDDEMEKILANIP